MYRWRKGHRFKNRESKIVDLEIGDQNCERGKTEGLKLRLNLYHINDVCESEIVLLCTNRVVTPAHAEKRPFISLVNSTTSTTPTTT